MILVLIVEFVTMGMDIDRVNGTVIHWNSIFQHRTGSFYKISDFNSIHLENSREWLYSVILQGSSSRVNVLFTTKKHKAKLLSHELADLLNLELIDGI